MADTEGSGHSLGNLIVHVKADISGIKSSLNAGQESIKTFTKQTNDATKSISESTGIMNNMLKNSIRYLMLHGIIVKGVLMTVRGVTSSIKNAMNMVEAENLFNVSMGNMANTARDWSNELQKTLRINAYEVRKNVGVFYNMTTAMGLTSDSAYDVSKGLTELAYDMSSFYNIPYEDAFIKLQAGITGEIEPLRRLGIIVNQNTTETYAYANGIAKQGAVLTEQQKVLARYGVILNSTKTAQGDLARTLESPANQARMLSTQIELLSINVGRIFLPVIQAAIPILNNMFVSLTNLANAAANFMENLFGVNYSTLASGTNKAANAQNNLANSTAKAAKAAKNSVMAFDEVNILQKETAGAGAGSSGAIANPAIPDVNAGNDVMKSGMLSQIFASPDFQPLIDSFNKLKSALEPLGETLFAGLKWAWDNVLVPIGAWTITQAVPAFFDLLAGALQILNPLLEAVQPLFKWLWDNFLQPIATWTGGIIVDTINLLADALSEIGEWMSKNKSTIEGIAIAFAAFFAVWELTKLFAFIEMSGGIVSALYAMVTALSAATLAKIANKFETIALTAMYAKDFIVGIGAAISKLTLSIAVWAQNTLAMIANKIALAASTVAQIAMTVATTAWNAICAVATALTTAFGAAVAFLTSPIGLVILAVGALIAIVVLLVKNWDTVKAVATKVWDSIISVWKVAATWFDKNIITPLSNFFSNLWDGIEKGFISFLTYLKFMLTGYINMYIIIVESFINFFIKGLNWIISGLNKIKFDVPDWVPLIGGKTFGVNIGYLTPISIPRLARGSIIDSPTIAMLGENNKKEAVVPLEDTSFVDKLASAVASAVLQAMQFSQPSSNLGSDSNREYVLQLDGSAFARLIIPIMRRELSRTGNVVLEGVV